MQKRLEHHTFYKHAQPETDETHHHLNLRCKMMVTIFEKLFETNLFWSQCFCENSKEKKTSEQTANAFTLIHTIICLVQ